MATKPSAIVQTDCKVGNSSIKRIHISTHTVCHINFKVTTWSELYWTVSWLPRIAFPILLLHPLWPSAFQQCINNFVLPWFNVTYTWLMNLYGQFCNQNLKRLWINENSSEDLGGCPYKKDRGVNPNKMVPRSGCGMQFFSPLRGTNSKTTHYLLSICFGSVP